MNDVNRRGRRELIALAADGDGPTNKQRLRLRASVLARVGASAMVGATATTVAAKAAAGVAGALRAGTSTPPIVAPSIMTSGMVAKVVAALALLTGVSASAYVVVASRSREARETRPTSEVVLATAEPAPTAAPVAPATAPLLTTVTPASPPVVASPLLMREGAPTRAVVRSTPQPTMTAAPPSTPSGSFEAETRALRDALAMLRDGRALEARAALDAQDSLYPGGALSEERGAARIDALCMLGLSEEARAVAARFFQDHPASLLGPRVRASCGGR